MGYRREATTELSDFADIEEYARNVSVIAKPPASALKKSSRAPVSISSSAAAIMRWKTSSVSKRSRTTAPTAGAPCSEYSTESVSSSPVGIARWFVAVA